MGHVVSSLVDSGIGTVIGNIAKAAANAVSVVAKFVSGLDPGIISGFTAALAGVVVGIKGLNFINKFNPFNLFKKNADDALADVVKKSRGSKSKLSQVFNGIGNVIAKTGTAIGTAAKGIGTGLKSAFQGITPAIKGLGTAVITSSKGNRYRIIDCIERSWCCFEDGESCKHFSIRYCNRDYNGNICVTCDTGRRCGYDYCFYWNWIC